MELHKEIKRAKSGSDTEKKVMFYNCVQTLCGNDRNSCNNMLSISLYINVLALGLGVEAIDVNETVVES